MNNLKKKVPKGSLYKEYVKILNGVLQLSPRETEVLAFIFQMDAGGFRDNINSKDIRDSIMHSLNISEANLSRYLGTIKSKGLIVKSDKGKWVINDLIRPNITNGLLNLTYTLEITDDQAGPNNKGPIVKV